ncbi:MAG: cysteine synthase family protein [Thermaerobacter sp.]|nr:cysteine synthase family protein [Thermaerobacter sp.]
MQVAQSVLDLIGQTPVLELRPKTLPEGVRLFAKLEYRNPGGSVKDRLGRHLIETALRDGSLRSGGTVIEPTAGNTGIGIALAAIGRGLRVVLVVPEHFSKEKQGLMRALGAEIVSTPRSGGMEQAIAEAHRLAKELGGYVPQQFANPANPEAHYLTTGPELYEQLDGRIDAFVAGGGSGGTLTGVARYLREQNPKVRVVLAEPVGSVFGGGAAGQHRTEGIGNEFVPATLDMSLVDRVETISDDDAFDAVKQLAKEFGVLVGSSSGAAYVACLRTAKSIGRGNVATIFPDGAERYLSQGIFD